MHAGFLTETAPIEPHPGQRELYLCRKRFVGVHAARRSGKTTIARRRLYRELTIPSTDGKPRRFLFGYPTEGMAKERAWWKVQPAIPEEWRTRTSESLMVIETRFGTMLKIAGLDRAERSEGDYWHGVIIDEACQCDWRRVNEAILPALSEVDGWLWMLGAPKLDGVGAAYFRTWCERVAANPEPDEAVFTWPSSVLLSPEQLAYLQATMDPVTYATQMEGVWASGGDRITYAFDADANVRPCKFDPDRPVLVGSDFNRSPMAWVYAHEYAGPPRRLEVFDELWLTGGVTTQRALDVTWERYGEHARAGFRFFGDASGRSGHTSASESDYTQIRNDERFRHTGATVHYPTANPPFKDRAGAVNALCCNAAGLRRLFVDPACEHLRHDLVSRVWKEGKDEPADRGQTGTTMGHISDALGYLVWVAFPVVPDHGVEKIVTTKGVA